MLMSEVKGLVHDSWIIDNRPIDKVKALCVEHGEQNFIRLPGTAVLVCPNESRGDRGEMVGSPAYCVEIHKYADFRR